MKLANNKYSDKDDLCQLFEFSERTFFRYMETFREAGFAVKHDEKNVYWIETSANKLSKRLSELLHFTEEEEIILRSAIDNIAPYTRSRELLKKKLYAIYDYKVLADVSVGRNEMAVIKELQTAMEEHRTAILKDYASSSSSTTTDREVEPYAFTDTKDMVWCYELKSHSVKTFKISRIHDVELTDQEWQYENFHKTGYVDIFRMHGTEEYHIVLRLTMRAANLLLEEYPLSIKYLTQKKNGTFLLDTNVCGFDGVTRFMLGLYDEIEIVKGDALQQALNKRIDGMKEKIKNPVH